jgi:hypothetical protein
VPNLEVFDVALEAPSQQASKDPGGDQLREGLPCRSGVETLPMALSPARRGGELFCSQQHGQWTSSLLCGGQARWEFRATIGEISGAVDEPMVSPGTVRIPSVYYSVLEGSVYVLSGPGGPSHRPMSCVPIHEPKPALKTRPYDQLSWLEDSIQRNSPCQHQNLSCPSQLLQCTQGHGAQENPTQQQWQVVRKKRWWRREKKGVNA